MSEMSLMVRKDSIDALIWRIPIENSAYFLEPFECLFEPLKDGQLSTNCLVIDVHGRCPLHTDYNVLSAKKRRWQ